MELKKTTKEEANNSPLNNSLSKTMYSFSKDERFKERKSPKSNNQATTLLISI